jgi:hypothetical protein
VLSCRTEPAHALATLVRVCAPHVARQRPDSLQELLRGVGPRALLSLARTLCLERTCDVRDGRRWLLI